jgi:hypothetical protein
LGKQEEVECKNRGKEKLQKKKFGRPKEVHVGEVLVGRRPVQKEADPYGGAGF